MGVGMPSAFKRYSATEFLPHAEKGIVAAWLPPDGYRYSPYTLEKLTNFEYRPHYNYWTREFDGFKLYSGWGQDLGLCQTEEQAGRAVAWILNHLHILGEVTAAGVVMAYPRIEVPIGTRFEIPFAAMKRHWEEDTYGTIADIPMQRVIKARRGEWKFLLKWEKRGWVN